jgi:hypothetical protein
MGLLTTARGGLGFLVEQPLRERSWIPTLFKEPDRGRNRWHVIHVLREI